MVFKPRQKRSICNIQISLDNQNIVKVKEANFLGVILDENLNWKSEISHVANKVAKSIGIKSRCSSFPPKSSLRMRNIFVLDSCRKRKQKCFGLFAASPVILYRESNANFVSEYNETVL